MPSVPENHTRGSKILPISCATTGFWLSPACMLRLFVCDISIAQHHSFANAWFACVRLCGSNTPARGTPEGLSCPTAFAMLAKKFCCAAAKSCPPRPHSSAIAFMYSNGITSEYHDLPHRLAIVQPVEAQVDLIELHAPAHQPIYGQLATPVEFDVTRQVARRNAGADIASLHGSLLGDKIHLRQRKGMVWRRQAGGGGGAAQAWDSIGEVHGAHGARHFKRKLDATARRGLNFVDRIGAASIERVGCSKLAREAELVVGEVDCDHASRATRARADQRPQADAAESDNRDAGAGGNLRSVDDATDAGKHRAAEQGCLIYGNLVVDRRQRSA